MKLYFPITVDLYNPHPLPKMNAQQHNIGRGSLITLTANGQVVETNEETVRIFARRPDGNVSYLDCTITEDGKIQADFTDQMLAVEGSTQVELELTTAETNITTPIFIVEVNKSNVKEGVQSSNEYKALEKYTAEAKEAAEHAQEVYDNIPNYEANLIVSKASGEVIATTDSAKVKPKNIKLFGKGKQRQYEGNQLLDLLDKINSVSSAGYTVNVVGGVVTVTGKNTKGSAVNLTIAGAYENTTPFITLEAGTYTVVDCMLDSFDGDTRQTYKDTFVLNEATNITWIKTRVFGSNEVVSSEITYPMLNTGDTALPWEPFTGNEPSPSLNYPQKTECLGESGSIGGKVLTTQFYDVSKITNTSALVDSDDWITVSIDNSEGTAIKYVNVNVPVSDLIKPSRQYLAICEVKSNTLAHAEIVSISTGANKSQFATGFGVAASTTGVFASTITARDDFTDSKTMLRTVLRANAGMSGSMKFRVSIIADTTVTSDTFVYEPYTEQSFTLLTPNGLRGIPLGQTIPNAIKNSPIHMNGVYHDGEQYYIADTKNEDGKDVQRIWKGNPSQTIAFSNRSNNGRCEKFSTSLFGVAFMSGLIPSMSTIALWSEYGNGDDKTISLSGNGIYYKDSTKTLDEVNALFAELGTDFEICGVLADPIITDTTEQHDVVMNYPNTTIVNDAGAYMEVEYVCDPKKHIEQNYTPKSVTEDILERLGNVESQIALNS